MYNLLLKHGQSMALGLGVLMIVIFLVTVSSGLSSAGYSMSTDLNGLEDEAKNAISFFNPIIALTIGLAVLAAVLAFVVFFITGMLKFPKESMKFIGGFVVLLIIFGIAYATSSEETTGRLTMLTEKFQVSGGTLKFINGGILVTILLCLSAAAMIVLSEVRNAFK